MGFLIRMVVTAVALWVAVQLIDGIDYTGTWPGLLGVALIFGFINAIIRPLLYLLSCPLIVLTLGLFILILNGLLLLLTAAIANAIGLPFVVDGLGAAILGALVIGITSMLLNIFVDGDRSKKRER